MSHQHQRSGGLTRRTFQGSLLGLAACGLPALAAPPPKPVLIGIDGEFGLLNSTSAQAVELGVRIAVDQINAEGGVLGGRPIEIVTKDHRSIPARGIRNIQEFKEMPDLVGVFGARFSPVIIEELPVLKAAKVPFLAVWSSADIIVDNGSTPNYAFRVSLRDSLAMPFMLRKIRERGLQRVGLLFTNTAWGRSNLAAVEGYNVDNPVPRVVRTAWYNWQERSLVDKYLKLLEAGAQAVLLVANDDEAAVLVKEMAALPRNKRVPIYSHWGVTGGKFAEGAGKALQEVEYYVIQTFSFFNARKAPLERFMASARKYGINKPDDIESPVGVAHAYDMAHILAKAINLAGTTDRATVRDALEKVPLHEGLVKRYAPPFTPTRHEGLSPAELLLARYREDGVIVPVEP